MVRSSTRFPTLGTSRAMIHVKLPSPNLQSKLCFNAVKSDRKIEFWGNGVGSSREKTESYGVGKRIMVVVDNSREAKGALQWALSHTVQSQDVVVLLYVIKQFKGEECNMKLNLRAHQLLHSLKNMCQKRRPGVNVEVAMAEGKEKGPTIVKEAKQRRISLLILGQRRRPSLLWRILRLWPIRSRRCREVVEYCIQNANCMTIAVRRKSKKLGGYLITTKQHKNFWLLA